MLKTKNPLVVMLDDDLILSKQVWSIILGLQENEFLLTRWRSHLSSRVFAIHKNDYDRVGGFDPSFHFSFEDGEFALRAQNAGLKLKVLPPNLFTHIAHSRRENSGPFGMNLGFWKEYAEHYVKFKRDFEQNLFDPFTKLPHDYKIAFQWFIVRSSLILFYIMKSTVKIPQFSNQKDNVDYTTNLDLDGCL